MNVPESKLAMLALIAIALALWVYVLFGADLV